MKIKANLLSNSLQLLGDDGTDLTPHIALKQVVITLLPQQAVKVEMVAYVEELNVDVLKEHATIVAE